MKPSDCPSFYSCNAAVCPLEPEIGHHLDRDQACPKARRITRGEAPADELHAAIAAGMPRVRERFPGVGRQWDRPKRVVTPEQFARMKVSGSARSGAAGE